jgi:uncharacterized membrane protein HdeD (DUF308 family)
MSVSPGVEVRKVIRHELEALRGKWLWFLVIGILMIVFGVIVMGAPALGGAAAVVTAGIFLMAGGITQAVASFWSKDWSGFFLSLLASAFFFVVGMIFVRKPDEAARALALLIAFFLMVEGIFRIVAAVVYRFPHWIWVALSGGLNLLLGFLIWNNWPEASFWVIGLFLGIDMIFNGVAWVMLALGLKDVVSGISARARELGERLRESGGPAPA